MGNICASFITQNDFAPSIINGLSRPPLLPHLGNKKSSWLEYKGKDRVSNIDNYFGPFWIWRLKQRGGTISGSAPKETHFSDRGGNEVLLPKSGGGRLVRSSSVILLIDNKRSWKDLSVDAKRWNHAAC